MKTALITGSTSGIGLATAELLASKGYNIVFHGLEANGQEIAADVAQKYGVKYAYSNANLMHYEEVKNLAEVALNTFPSIDVLVNNAGIQFVNEVDTFPLEKWDAIIQVNLNAAFQLTQLIIPSMKKNKFGRIINLSSAHGLIASPFKSAYVSSKFGIIGFTKTVALEGAPYNITSNAICPGYVMTPIVKNQIPDQMKVHNMTEDEVINNIFLKEHAVKKFISTEAIAAAVEFLVDSPAAEVITGIALPVDAGWTTH